MLEARVRRVCSLGHAVHCCLAHRDAVGCRRRWQKLEIGDYYCTDQLLHTRNGYDMKECITDCVSLAAHLTEHSLDLQ